MHLFCTIISVQMMQIEYMPMQMVICRWIIDLSSEDFLVHWGIHQEMLQIQLLFEYYGEF